MRDHGDDPMTSPQQFDTFGPEVLLGVDAAGQHAGAEPHLGARSDTGGRSAVTFARFRRCWSRPCRADMGRLVPASADRARAGRCWSAPDRPATSSTTASSSTPSEEVGSSTPSGWGITHS